MHQDWHIEHWEQQYVYAHTWVAHHQCPNTGPLHFRKLYHVTFRAKVVLILDQVHLILCASSMSADALLCSWGKSCSCPFDFHQPLLGVLPMQPSRVYTLETKPPSSSLLQLRREDPWSGIVFPLLWQVETLLWVFAHIQYKVHVTLW